MRVLELYSGYESSGSMIRELGFSVVSFSLETFDMNQYPKESNIFDIIIVNINNIWDRIDLYICSNT